MVCTHSAGAWRLGATAACGIRRAMFSSAAIHTQPVGGRRLDWRATRVHSVVERVEVLTAKGVRHASPGPNKRSALTPASLLLHAGRWQS